MKTHVFMFDTRFEERILSGVKFSTCRPRRARLPVAGDWMDQRVWAGRPYWSPQKKLGLVELVHGRSIELLMKRETGAVQFCDGGKVRWESDFQLQAFATQEGFDSWPALVDYFIKKKGAAEGVWVSQDLYTWRPASRKP